jgi:hypothetical protein
MNINTAHKWSSFGWGLMLGAALSLAAVWVPFVLGVGIIFIVFLNAIVDVVEG